MRYLLPCLPLVALFLSAATTCLAAAPEPATKPSTQPVGPLGFTMKTIDGDDKNLADYRGSVLMFVNVASKCGNTPQYTALEATYEKYKDKGFAVLMPNVFFRYGKVEPDGFKPGDAAEKQKTLGALFQSLTAASPPQLTTQWS